MRDGGDGPGGIGRIEILMDQPGANAARLFDADYFCRSGPVQGGRKRRNLIVMGSPRPDTQPDLVAFGFASGGQKERAII